MDNQTMSDRASESSESTYATSSASLAGGRSVDNLNEIGTSTGNGTGGTSTVIGMDMGLGAGRPLPTAEQACLDLLAQLQVQVGEAGMRECEQAVTKALLSSAGRPSAAALRLAQAQTGAGAGAGAGSRFSTPQTPATSLTSVGKKARRSSQSDFFNKTATPAQECNRSLRFGEGSKAEASRGWGFFMTDDGGKMDYEDVTDAAILSAPISDICLVPAKTPPPEGYYRCHKTPSNKKADLNFSQGSSYLCLKKDLSGRDLHVTNLVVVFPDRNEFPPPGYTAVTSAGVTTGSRIYLCLRKSRGGNPLTDLQVIIPQKGEEIPQNFHLLERSVSGLQANLNPGGAETFLCYRQQLQRLACLLCEAPEQEEASIQSRLRMRRNTLRSFDDAPLGLLGLGGSLKGGGGGGIGGTGVGSGVVAGVGGMSLALAPVSIDSSGFLAHRGRSQSLAGVGASAGIGAGMGMGASVGSGTDTGTRSRSGTGESTPNSPEQSSAMARLRTLYQLDESPSLSDTKSPGGSADGVGGVGGAGGVEGGGAGDVGMGCVGGAGSVGVVDSPTEEDGGRSRMVSFSNLSDGDTVGSASEGTDLGTAAQRMLRSSFDSEEGGEMKLGGVGGTGEGKGNREAERVACYSPTSQCVGGGVGGVGGAGMGVGGMDGEEEDDQFKAEMTHLLLQVATRSHSEVRDSAGLVPPQHKRLALFAILGALYIRHSGAALTALAGLVGLLRLSDFFVGDLESLPVGLTMLDLVLEASCDRFDAESGDSPEQVLLLELLTLVSTYAGQALSLQSLQRVFRTLSFLCVNHTLTRAEGLPPPPESQYQGLEYDDYDTLAYAPPYVARSKLLGGCLRRVEDAPVAVTLPGPSGTGPSAPGTCTATGGGADAVKHQLVSYGSAASMASAASGTSAASEASADSGSGSKSDEVYEITDLPADDAGAAAKARSVGFSLTDAGAGVEADAGIDSTPLVLSIVLDFLDEVLDSLEVARLSEMGLITISKTLHTAHSESFWRELAALSFSLFSHHAYRSAFCLLGALCKQCWLPIRTRVAGKGAVGAGAAGGKGGAGKGGAVGGRVGGEADSRDVGAKLSALSALEEFLLKSGECLTQSKIFGYQVRRIVVPCLLYNVAFAFLDSRVFAKLLRVVTALWRRWRTHCRIEFAILCEQFVFRVMQANAVQTRAVEKLLLIQEVVRWFEQPHLLLEMFVNYDMDRKFVSHWNTFSYLVRTLCSIGKRLVFSLAEDQETPPPTPTYGSTSTSYTSGEVKVLGVREVHLQALTEVARIAKTLMDASGHAYLILQDSGFRNKSLMGGGGWVEDEETTSLKGAVKAAGLQAAAMAMSAASSAASSATASASPTPTASAAPTPVGMTHFFATPVGTTPFFPASNPATPTAASDATDATTPVDAAVDADSTASATASASASAATTPTTAAPSPDKYDSNTVSNTVSNTNATDLGYIYAAEPPAPVLPTPTPTPTTAPTAPTTTVADAADTPTSASVRHSPKKRREGSIKMRRRAHEEAEQLISEAIKIYAAKQDMKKAVKYLVNKGFMDDTPQEVANFLRVYKNSFDPGAIGDFLGEGGINAAEEEYWSQIRFRYTRAVSFVEMDVEPALRLYLTGCGFRLPGEAQKINRYVEAFVQAFWQDNSGTPNCPFKHPDTVHLITYAVIMLNTDHHRVNMDKKKKCSKMTRDQFLNQLRGCDQGGDIDRAYLERIYDNVEATAIELQIGLVKKAAGSAEDPKMYSIRGVSAEVKAVEEQKFQKDLCASLRDSEDLLRSMAPFSFPFSITNVDLKMSLDLVSFMFESVWFHFSALAEALLSAQADVYVQSKAVDILVHSLTSAIFLDLKEKRLLLADLLLAFRKKLEATKHRKDPNRKIPDESWYDDAVNAFPPAALTTISKLHHLTVYIKDHILEGVNYEKTCKIADTFEKKARIMEKNSYFVRQGDLEKISSTGKSAERHFFLFSDQIMYTHASRGGWVVHEALGLLELEVVEVPGAGGASFYLQHPIKSFVVVAADPSEMGEWVRDIRATIAACKSRHSAEFNSKRVRHMSIVGRLQSLTGLELKHDTAPTSTAAPSASTPNPPTSTTAASTSASAPPSAPTSLRTSASAPPLSPTPTAPASPCTPPPAPVSTPVSPS